MNNKADATKMKQKKQRELTPRLRFPEFQDTPEWEEKKLLDVCDINPSNEGLPEFFVYIDLESVVAGILIYNKKIYRDGAPSRAQRLLQHGDVIYQIVRPYQRNNFFCDFDNENSYVASTGYAQLRSFDVSKFLYQLVHTDTFVNKVIDKCTGSNYPAINSSDLAEITVPIPKAPEQQKIADCLSSLDELIAAQGQKLDALKSHKKGLMQQLFPAEGESLPQLRFPEFRDAPEWDAIPMGEKVNLLSGYPFDGVEISEDSRGIRLLRGINITEGEIRHNHAIDRYYLGNIDKLERYKVQIDDLVIGMDGSKVGKNVSLITSLDAGALLVQRVARLRADRLSLIQFIFHQINSSTFHSYVDRINTSSGIPHISAKQINEFPICFPSIDEQQKIADCLTSLDELIAAQSQKLEALKAHKKGLMQQLFPSVEEMQG